MALTPDQARSALAELIQLEADREGSAAARLDEQHRQTVESLEMLDMRRRMAWGRSETLARAALMLRGPAKIAAE